LGRNTYIKTGSHLLNEFTTDALLQTRLQTLFWNITCRTDQKQVEGSY